jgi:hypothetical protein
VTTLDFGTQLKEMLMSPRPPHRALFTQMQKSTKPNQVRRATIVATAVSLTVGAAFASGYAPAAQAAVAPNRPVSIAVPAYFDDDALWTKAIGTPQVSYIIGHPDSPKDGKYSTDAKLTAHIAEAKKGGKTTLVYVTAGYTKVTWQALGDSIESALAAYPQADGVFLDEIGYDQCDKFTSLKNGAGAIKGIKARIGNKLLIDNPGAPLLNCFESLADGFLNLERENAKVDEWIANVNAPGNVPYYSWMFKPENRPRIWQMVHDVTTAKVNDAVDGALSRNASVLFVTNDKLPNPYDTLPDDATWKALLDRVDLYNNGKALPATIKLTVPPTTPAVTSATVAKATATTAPKKAVKPKTKRKKRK